MRLLKLILLFFSEAPHVLRMLLLSLSVSCAIDVCVDCVGGFAGHCGRVLSMCWATYGRCCIAAASVVPHLGGRCASHAHFHGLRRRYSRQEYSVHLCTPNAFPAGFASHEYNYCMMSGMSCTQPRSKHENPEMGSISTLFPHVAVFAAFVTAVSSSPWYWPPINLNPGLIPLGNGQMPFPEPGQPELISYHSITSRDDVRTAVLTMCPRAADPVHCLVKIEAAARNYIVKKGRSAVNLRMLGSEGRNEFGSVTAFPPYEAVDTTARLFFAGNNSTFTQSEDMEDVLVQAIALGLAKVYTLHFRAYSLLLLVALMRCAFETYRYVFSDATRAVPAAVPFRRVAVFGPVETNVDGHRVQ
jgi:hypothetical protein